MDNLPSHKVAGGTEREARLALFGFSAVAIILVVTFILTTP
jgi:hypothetical protein